MKAAIVTCGGLCPGLNVVIREIVMSLSYNYKVKEIYGIQFGYRGFYQYDWLPLTPEKVKTIHHLGGTILGSSRGGFDLDKIIEGLDARHINHLYVIGGDGTHNGMQKIQAEVAKRGIKMAVCGLPKTIDNDIPIIDKSFGFETSVEVFIIFFIFFNWIKIFIFIFIFLYKSLLLQTNYLFYSF